MSPRNISVVLALLFVTSSSALAVDKQKSERKAAAKQQKAARVLAVNQSERTYITGSFIRRPVMRNGLVTDFSSPVCVVDSADIQKSGATNLKQALQHYGAGR